MLNFGNVRVPVCHGVTRRSFLQVLASIYQGMGINLDTTMMPGPGERPIKQLFG